VTTFSGNDKQQTVPLESVVLNPLCTNKQKGYKAVNICVETSFQNSICGNNSDRAREFCREV